MSSKVTARTSDGEFLSSPAPPPPPDHADGTHPRQDSLQDETVRAATVARTTSSRTRHASTPHEGARREILIISDETEETDAPSPATPSSTPARSRHPSSTQGRFWRNPFLIALIAFGVGLIAFGADRYAWATSMLFPHASAEPPADGSTIAPQVLWVISPLLVISGVLAVVAVLVLAVIAWLPRRQG